MADPILYSRKLPQGPVVRIRRTSPDGSLPIVLALEVDRRAGTAREAEGGFPPPLMTAEGHDAAELLSQLQLHADDDRSLAALMHQKGLR
jgi:hypothetical protein